MQEVSDLLQRDHSTAAGYEEPGRIDLISIPQLGAVDQSATEVIVSSMGGRLYRMQNLYVMTLRGI
jgi:hypothetical protein